MQATTPIDFDARYTVDGYRGIAFYLVGYATRTVQDEDEDEDGDYFYEEVEVTDETMVRAVMVGDDREHLVDVDDLTLIDDLDYCACCGQIGCQWDGRDRA